MWLVAKLFLKSCIGYIVDGITFMVKHWKVFVPLLMALAAWWYVSSLQGQRDDAVAKLAAYEQKAKDERIARRVQNTINQGAVAAAISVIDAGHKAEESQIRKQYEAKFKTEKNAADTGATNWRDSLRHTVASNASAGVPGLSESTGESAGSGGDCDTTALGKAYDTLEMACALTTSDYNALHQAWDKTCSIYGCSEVGK
jgi:hypothetical protein